MFRFVTPSVAYACEPAAVTIDQAVHGPNSRPNSRFTCYQSQTHGQVVFCPEVKDEHMSTESHRHLGLAATTSVGVGAIVGGGILALAGLMMEPL